MLHVLFQLGSPGAIPTEISERAIKAAQNFVDMCCQHTAFIAGRGDIQDAIQQIQRGSFHLLNTLYHSCRLLERQRYQGTCIHIYMRVAGKVWLPLKTVKQLVGNLYT